MALYSGREKQKSKEELALGVEMTIWGVCALNQWFPVHILAFMNKSSSLSLTELSFQCLQGLFAVCPTAKQRLYVDILCLLTWVGFDFTP